MGKLEYLDALRRAMAGLPPEAQAKTLAYYEQRFVDAAGTGRAEADVSQELGDPKKIAMTLRANAHLSSFQQKPNPVSMARVVVSSVGLIIFNLFMVVPAMVYGSLLASMYAVGLALYIGGIAVTASGLAGAHELVLDGPFRHIVVEGDTPQNIGQTRTRIQINETGVHVDQEKVPEDQPPKAGGGILIETDVDGDSRTTQTLFGLGLVLGGIMMLLLSLVVTRFTFVGIKRYVHMNIALLKGS